MKKIIVPIDFSSCSIYALEAAVHLAKKCSAKIELVYVYERPIHGFIDLSIDHEANKKVVNEIKQKFEQLKEYNWFEGVTVNTHIIANIELQEMIQVKSLRECDIIVMGTHGNSNLLDNLFGSNTERVLRNVNIPVLAINDKPQKDIFNKIIFASDFTPDAELSFKGLIRIIEQVCDEVELLYIYEPGNKTDSILARKRMEVFGENNLSIAFNINVYPHKSISKGIQIFSQLAASNLIVMYTNGRKGLNYLVNGSRTAEVISGNRIPVLSITMVKPSSRQKRIRPTNDHFVNYTGTIIY